MLQLSLGNTTIDDQTRVLDLLLRGFLFSQAALRRPAWDRRQNLGPLEKPFLANAKLLKTASSQLCRGITCRVMQQVGQQMALLHQHRPTPGSPVSPARFQGQDVTITETGEQVWELAGVKDLGDRRMAHREYGKGT